MTITATTWTAVDPAEHCFREDNCPQHPHHTGSLCCCCNEAPEAHAGCDCERVPS